MPDFRTRLLTDLDFFRSYEAFTRFHGQFGEREVRVMPLSDLALRASGDPATPEVFTVKGHAAVFNRLSLNLGGFQEKIDKAAFADVLDTDPDVHLLWDHDTRYPLARTRSNQYLLELREDPKGLHTYAKVAPTTFASDLRVLMESGVIDQMSFAFTVESDTWEIHEEGGEETVIRTIHKIGDLFDVTICAQGAYPQTDSSVVRAYAQYYAESNGRLEGASSTEDDASREAEEVGRSASTDEVEQGADPDVVAEAEAITAAAEGNEPESPSHDVGGSSDQPTERVRELSFRMRRALELSRHDMETLDERANR